MDLEGDGAFRAAFRNNGVFYVSCLCDTNVGTLCCLYTDIGGADNYDNILVQEKWS